MLEVNEEVLKYMELYAKALARIEELEQEVLILTEQLIEATDDIFS